MCINEDTHLCFFEKSIGIFSIAVIWYNRVVALFERSTIPALIFIIRSQSELNPLNFFVFIERAFWYPWFGDLTS